MHHLEGQKFGRLTAVGIVGSSKNKHKLWYCACDCGGSTVVASDSLVSGGTRSCGCLQRETRVVANTKHGDCGTRLYRIWKGFVSRCKNKSSTDFKWYGAKGVSVCEEWLKYENFKAWAIANGYDDSLTLDRIDPRGNYEPNNCRWATIAEQNKNKRCDKE